MREDLAFLDEAQLDALFEAPAAMVERATTRHLTEFHHEFLKRATFFVIASGGTDGFDASPRGGSAGLVHPLDDHTVCFADWPGNNKIETLRNIVRNPAVGLVFLFPGLDMFMRINGKAGITQDMAIRECLAEGAKVPKVAVVVAIEAVYFHCGKAINRAGLWKSESMIDRRSVPSPGTMMKALAEIEDMPAADLDQHYRESMTKDLFG
ncbi:hypothetical protein B2G71_04520 [Novosphingobium sp. PC22D]|uniref:MSMEG_1061 family FMN-dependent PPOX-type flavoprotein n=1 Tax=Novosphingobium sp. PC22D TaxID=1962403 RepID=UPI000BFAC0F0|nr:MSMEG_1061 family FMN-dependent PPOX-type flavoprotein [Novosphingobium sp. PC22D]PEQ13601.1 hypothetical protein B2G71_04520 [Novosphingobium sp. PC22D]